MFVCMRVCMCVQECVLVFICCACIFWFRIQLCVLKHVCIAKLKKECTKRHGKGDSSWFSLRVEYYILILCTIFQVACQCMLLCAGVCLCTYCPALELPRESPEYSGIRLYVRWEDLKNTLVYGSNECGKSLQNAPAYGSMELPGGADFFQGKFGFWEYNKSWET